MNWIDWLAFAYVTIVFVYITVTPPRKGLAYWFWVIVMWSLWITAVALGT